MFIQHGAINICTSPLNRLHCYKWSQVDHWLRWIQVAKINFSQRRSTLITIASRVSLPLYEVYTLSLARASTCIIYKMCSCLHLLQSGKRRGSGYHGSYKNGQESLERFCVSIVCFFLHHYHVISKGRNEQDTTHRKQKTYWWKNIYIHRKKLSIVPS